ncbi:MAG: hypothetical protein EOO85_02730 [Pedobacter sp.]|nr:MAG: hypothetical protein EOO85_02730 [Pedobacter sp.]
MFDKIKQIIKEKYGDKAELYEPKEPVFSKGILDEPQVEPWVSPYLDGTLPMPKSKRSSVGRSGKSNRKRLSHNAKLKRRRAA